MNAERWSSFHTVLTVAAFAMLVACILVVCSGCTLATVQVGKVLRLSLDASLTWPAKVDLLPAEPADRNALDSDVAPNIPPDIPPGALPPPR